MNACINGFDMAFDLEGSGPPVLLIHGFPLNRKMWRSQAMALVATGFQVITPDLRGFGQSSVGEEDQAGSSGGMDLLADDLVALLDHLEVEEVIVAGMSMGGYVLLNLLARYPERVGAACFLVTRADPDDQTARDKRDHLIAEVESGNPVAVADGFIKVLFAEETYGRKPELVDEVHNWLAATDPAGLLLGLRAIRDRVDSRPLLSELTLPVLVVGAVNDQAIPPDRSGELAATIPGAQLRLIEKAGHMANLEETAAFNQALLLFLDSLS